MTHSKTVTSLPHSLATTRHNNNLHIFFSKHAFLFCLNDCSDRRRSGLCLDGFPTKPTIVSKCICLYRCDNSQPITRVKCAKSHETDPCNLLIVGAHIEKKWCTPRKTHGRKGSLTESDVSCCDQPSCSIADWCSSGSICCCGTVTRSSDPSGADVTPTRRTRTMTTGVGCCRRQCWLTCASGRGLNRRWMANRPKRERERDETDS